MLFTITFILLEHTERADFYSEFEKSLLYSSSYLVMKILATTPLSPSVRVPSKSGRNVSSIASNKIAMIHTVIKAIYYHSETFQSSILLFSVENLTPILNIFLESFTNGLAYPFSSICCNAASAVLSIFNSII